MEKVSAPNARLITATLLVLANLLPLLGVLMLGWDVASLLYAYWLESAVVGFFNVFRIAQAQAQPPLQPRAGRREMSPQDLRRIREHRQRWETKSPGLARLLRSIEASADSEQVEKEGETADSSRRVAQALAGPAGLAIGKTATILFFLVHYGFFMLGHAIFLWAFFGPPEIPTLDLFIMGGLLFLSHGTSYVIYYLLRGECMWATPNQQMGRPYGRIVIMHITIIIAGFLTTSLDAPVFALAVMVLIKIAIDLAAHLRSHARYEGMRPFEAPP